MDTQQLRTFIEVVRQGSFAAAARRLDLAPSQVTRAVAALESELGARLMHRTTRKLTLTESGAAYFRRVSELMDELDAAADDVRVSSGDIRGLVRLTASVALGQKLVLPLLRKLHLQHPGLQQQWIVAGRAAMRSTRGLRFLAQSFLAIPGCHWSPTTSCVRASSPPSAANDWPLTSCRNGASQPRQSSPLAKCP